MLGQPLDTLTESGGIRYNKAQCEANEGVGWLFAFMSTRLAGQQTPI